MGYYNYRVTNSWLRFPYLHYEATHARGVQNYFAHVHKDKVQDKVTDVQAAYEKGVEKTQEEMLQRSFIMDLLLRGMDTSQQIFLFFIGPVLLVPLLLFPCTLKDRWILLAFAVTMLVMAAITVLWYRMPHYPAPIVPLIYLLIFQGMRRLSVWRWGKKRPGRLMLRGIFSICVLSFVLKIVIFISPLHSLPPQSWPYYRHQIMQELQQREGQHLIMVRYHQIHPSTHEWVYNGADIDNAKIIWARELDDNTKLLNHYQGRQIWLLLPDAKPPKLRRYSPIKQKEN